jgi:hypothetical protein
MNKEYMQTVAELSERNGSLETRNEKLIKGLNELRSYYLEALEKQDACRDDVLRLRKAIATYLEATKE